MAVELAGVPENNPDFESSNPQKQTEIDTIRAMEARHDAEVAKIVNNPDLKRTKAGNLNRSANNVKAALANVERITTMHDASVAATLDKSRNIGESRYVTDKDLAFQMATAEDPFQTKAVAAEKNDDAVTARIHRETADKASGTVSEIAKGTMEVASRLEGALGKEAAVGVRDKGFETAAKAGEKVGAEIEAKRQATNAKIAEAVDGVQHIVAEKGQSQIDKEALGGVKLGYKISELPFSERTITEPNGARVYERFMKSEATPGLVLVERYSAANGDFINAIAIKGESDEVSQPEIKRQGLRRRRRPTGLEEPTADILGRLDSAKQVYRKNGPVNGTGNFSAENGDNLGAYIMRSNGASEDMLGDYANHVARKQRRPSWFMRILGRNK